MTGSEELLNQQYAFLRLCENPLQVASAKHKFAQLLGFATPARLEPIRTVVTNPAAAFPNRSIKQMGALVGVMGWMPLELLDVLIFDVLDVLLLLLLLTLVTVLVVTVPVVEDAVDVDAVTVVDVSVMVVRV
jgi:hypothetical protein